MLFIGSGLLPFTDWRAPTGSYYILQASHLDLDLIILLLDEGLVSSFS